MSSALIPAFVPGGPEMLIVLFLLVLLFFGPKKIPELARSTGEATKEWKKGRQELEEEIQQQKAENADDEKEKETA